MKRTSLWPQLGLFVILTTGAAVAWGLGAGFITSLCEMHLAGASQHTVYENLVVTLEGEPLIGGYSYAGNEYRALPYRTLAGQTVDKEQVEELSPASLQRKPAPRRWHEGPIPWSGRLTWTQDGRMAPTTWRLIRDDTNEGRAYFVGYDDATRLCVGYLGRRGFRGSPPPQNEQFAVGPEPFNYFGGARVTGTTLAGGYRVASSGESAPSWCVYLVDGEKVVEANVRQRSVRTLLESSEIESISILYRPKSTAEGASKAGPGNLDERLAVRLADRIEVINPAGDDRAAFPLPESLRHAEGLTVYQVSDEQLLIVQSDRMRGAQQTQTKLWWLDNQGEVTREQAVDLAGYVQQSDRHGATIAFAVVPIPAAITPLLVGPAALSKVQMGQAKDYREALAQMMSAAWPPYVVLLAACAAAAWMVARRQRQHAWPHTGVWCAAVFLTGMPGLIAYLIEHRREARAACPACGRIVPRKREACAACGGAFPEPRLTGVEVFA